MLYLAYWGSSPDSIGRVWLFLVLVVFATQLRWQERLLGKALRSGISLNKAVFPIFWRSSGSVLCRSTGRSSAASFVKPSRWWSGAGGDSGDTVFNKRYSLLWSWQFPLLLLLPPSGRGGVGRNSKPATFCNNRGDGGVQELIHDGGKLASTIFSRHGGGVTTSSEEALIRSSSGCS
jgi:hypothetical protein